MLYMPNLTILLKYTVADLCLHNLSKTGTKMPDSCDSKPFQAQMVPNLTPCFSVLCPALLQGSACPPGIPLVVSAGAVKPELFT